MQSFKLCFSSFDALRNQNKKSCLNILKNNLILVIFEQKSGGGHVFFFFSILTVWGLLNNCRHQLVVAALSASAPVGLCSPASALSSRGLGSFCTEYKVLVSDFKHLGVASTVHLVNQ